MSLKVGYLRLGVDEDSPTMAFTDLPATIAAIKAELAKGSPVKATMAATVSAKAVEVIPALSDRDLLTFVQMWSMEFTHEEYTKVYNMTKAAAVAVSIPR